MAVFFDDKLGGCSCARSKCSDECSTYRSFKSKPQTNADRIRAMSDEELAELLHPVDCLDCPLNSEETWCGGSGKSCREKVINWLKQEAVQT